MIVEIACGNFQSVLNAKNGGAGRIELCCALPVGGLTPSFALLKKALPVFEKNVFVLIRPREGNFVYSDEEIEIMLDDIHLAKEMGAGGIVSGALTVSNKIDTEKTELLIKACGHCEFTFHRAFDFLADPITSLDLLSQMGVKRILTSGQKPDALQGKNLIRTLVEHSSGISVMAGAGINPVNVSEIISYTGVEEVHLSAGVKTDVRNSLRLGGSDSGSYSISDERTIRLVISEINKLR